MLKAAGRTADGLPVVLLGLSEENVTRLRQDQPIRVNLADLGLDECIVVLCHGPTEAHIRAQLDRHFRVTEAFTCPDCGATSFNPSDVRERYCGRCHAWTGADT